MASGLAALLVCSLLLLRGRAAFAEPEQAPSRIEYTTLVSAILLTALCGARGISLGRSVVGKRAGIESTRRRYEK